MDTSRNDLLSELAADAALERSDYLVQASAQLRRFLDKNESRIRELGGIILIDDEVDYLALAADLSFRSRSRYLNEATGKWVSETDVIENPSELVELYNLADVFAAFGDATGSEVGLDDEAPGAESGADGDAQPTAVGGENPYAALADEWAAAGHDSEVAPENEEEAAARLYDLALAFQERSQQTEAHLLEQFESAAAQLTAVLGDLIIIDDEDERLTLRASGAFGGEVIPETETETGQWRKLDGADDIVEFYDPTDIFGDLADTLAESFPALGEYDSAQTAQEGAGEPAADVVEPDVAPDGESEGDADRR